MSPPPAKPGLSLASWLHHRGGLVLTVSLGTALVAVTAGAGAAPPGPISSATVSATAGPATLVPHPSASTVSARPNVARAVAVAPASLSVRSARVTKIVLNPGHNGANWSHPRAISRQVPAGFGQHKNCDTTGTATNGGLSEHAFNWDVSLRVRKILQARGITVILTRPSDHGVGPCVDTRARIGNQAGVAAVISIHADGARSSGHGFHVSEASRRPHGAAVAAASHRLTVAVHDALRARSGMTTSTYLGWNGYYPRADLSGLNLARVPATFVEIGNMRNRGDAAIQASPSGRQRIAGAVAAGILRWLGR